MSDYSEVFAASTVLVVEDQEFMREMVVSILNRLGFADVLQAAEGEEGIALCQEKKPAVVVCDINMKPVDGIEFLRRVREGEGGIEASLPVVFLTNDAQEETVMAAREYKANAFIVKPVTVKALETKLGQILSR